MLSCPPVPASIAVLRSSGRRCNIALLRCSPLALANGLWRRNFCRKIKRGHTAPISFCSVATESSNRHQPGLCFTYATKCPGMQYSTKPVTAYVQSVSCTGIRNFVVLNRKAATKNNSKTQVTKTNLNYSEHTQNEKKSKNTS